MLGETVLAIVGISALPVVAHARETLPPTATMEALIDFGFLRPTEPQEGVLTVGDPEAVDTSVVGMRSQLGWNANVGMTMQPAAVGGCWNRAGVAPGLISADKLLTVMR